MSESDVSVGDGVVGLVRPVEGVDGWDTCCFGCGVGGIEADVERGWGGLG